jgi:hypothetical protein
MIDLPENELFSAYLDGELTAEEQAQVEQVLATSAAARQLMEELRALSSTLQSLPVQKPRVDLSQRVLRAAERQVLSGSQAVPPPKPAPAPPETVSLPSPVTGRDLWKRVLRPRSLLWAAAIFLVALALHQLEPGQPNQANLPPAGRHGGDEIASVEPQRPGKDQQGPSIRAASSDVAGSERKAEERAAPRAKSAEPRLMEKESAAATIAKSAPGAPPASAPPAAFSGPPRIAADAAAGMPAAPGLGEGGGKAGAPERKAPSDQVVLDLKDKDGDGRLEEKRAYDAKPGATFGSSSRQPALAGQAPPAPATPRADSQLAGAHKSAPTGMPFAPKAPARAGKGQAEEPLLLVECEVTPQVVQPQWFEKVLAEEQLSGQWVERRRRSEAVSRGALAVKPGAAKAGKAGTEGLPEAAEKAAKKTAEEAKSLGGAGRGPADGERARVADTRTFEIRATAQQVKTILARLQARPEDFLCVTTRFQGNLFRDNQLRRQSESGKVAADSVKREQARQDRSAGEIQGQAHFLKKPGMTAGASPPAAPPAQSVTAQGAQDRPKEKAAPQAPGKVQAELLSQNGNAARSELKSDEAEATFGTARGAVAQAEPSRTYRVRFILRVVAPESSAAGGALTGGAGRPADAAESAVAKPAATEPMLAKPKAANPAPAPAAAPSKDR